MLEPPSDHLWSRLRDELWCTSGDLRRARSRVKRLARDLPAFDTVWIDAFVQTGRLTPFQARLLEADPNAVLRIGEFVLLEELGRGSRSQTWLARKAPRSAPVVLKRIGLPSDLCHDVLHRLKQLTLSESHPCVELVREYAAVENGVLLVSRFVNGLPLSDVLVRRGRFPAQVVMAIARQLIDALLSAHATGIIHGDIRRSHIRITNDGRAVLVETGVRILVPSDITVHAPLALEAYDGIAPELIGIGRVATPATDWYALGCVLWQLLAGRPPFPTADPLAKLAAHQTQTVEDIRERAPDTPPLLATLISGLTHLDPEQRIAAAHEFQQHAGPPRRADRRTIAAFQHDFDIALPHLRGSPPGRALRWPLAVTAGCLGATLAAVLFDSGLRTELLSATAQWSRKGSSEASPPAIFSADLLPLPTPSPDGTIVLTQPGPYAAATIRFPGTLTLRAAAGVCPEILIRDRPLRVAASHWKCEGVRFRCDRLFRAADPAPALVEAVATRVSWQRCTLDLGEPLQRQHTERVTAIVGAALQTGIAASVTLKDCLFRGEGTQIQWDVTPSGDGRSTPLPATQTLVLDNLLHTGRGALVSLSACHELSLTMRHVTQRDAGPLVAIQPSALVSPTMVVTAEDSVFQPAHGAAVLEYIAAGMPTAIERLLVWSGEGSVLSPNVSLLMGTDSTSGTHTELPTDGIELEGLARGHIQFAGFLNGSPAESVVIDAEVPRRAPEPPGIVPDRFNCHSW